MGIVVGSNPQYTNPTVVVGPNPNNMIEPFEPQWDSQATPPAAPAAPGSDYGLPPHWQAAMDPYGNVYYWNDATREVSWGLPLQNVANYLIKDEIRKNGTPLKPSW